MNYCKDCRHTRLNTEDWGSPHFQSVHRLCAVSKIDPVNGEAECEKERSFALFGNRCGPSGRYFEPKPGAQPK